MTIMPVLPDLLVWAREHRGLTVDAAAELLGIEVTELIALESGAPLNLTKFRKVSGRYRIPGATLLRRTRPTAPPLPRDFRTVGGQGAVVGFETRLAIDYARTIESHILELVDSGFGPPTPVLPRVSLVEDASEAGERERERLGVSVTSQLGWKPTDAFNIWRAILERAGCFVLLKNFDLNQCKGFTLYDNPSTPIIMISKKEQYEPARTFTLLHEYAHLLLREPGISDHDDRNPVESFCNRFAEGFLLPRAAIRAILPAWPAEPVEWSIHDIREWAHMLKVSQQVLALRLEHLNAAPAGFYGRIVAQQQRVNKMREIEGGSYVNSQMFELGNRYLRAVFTAAEAGEIRTAEASDMIDLAPKHFDYVKAQVDQKFERANVAAGGISN
jgi:Zn-dependent peptidase ImmA (M78 family)/transcriptional regulator with XRE-family HTH domain